MVYYNKVLPSLAIRFKGPKAPPGKIPQDIHSKLKRLTAGSPYPISGQPGQLLFCHQQPTIVSVNQAAQGLGTLYSFRLSPDLWILQQVVPYIEWGSPRPPTPQDAQAFKRLITAIDP